MTDPRTPAGDPRRSGRASPAEAFDAPPRIELQFSFSRADGCIYAVLGRMRVGMICQETARAGAPGWNWLCELPEHRPTHKFAATLQKAKDAMRVAVEGWCEAARLVPAPRRHKREVRAFRAEGGA